MRLSIQAEVVVQPGVACPTYRVELEAANYGIPGTRKPSVQRGYIPLSPTDVLEASILESVFTLEGSL